MSRLSPLTSTLLIIVGSLALLIAQTALWLTASLYNQAYFTDTVVSVLKQEPVRQAMAEEVVTQTLVNRPLLQRLAGTYLQPAVVGILGSSQFETMLRYAANKFHAYAIAQAPQDIIIDITTLKQVLILLTTLTDTSLETALNPVDLPDQITLIAADEIPALHQTVAAAVWVGPLAIIIALALFVIAIGFSQDPAAETARTGLIVAASALIFYLAVPYLNHITSIYLPTATSRTIYTALYTAFTTPLVYRLLNQVFIGLGLTTLVVLSKVIAKNRLISLARRQPAPKKSTRKTKNP
ncbi:hypothetical protein A2W24_05075 [Microgenomates group bacterium RBG_16_45_19]|nr:MAG: hypothetical protein A2W24_05075 [Microgenomates group bacterium RBG_16_45_19]